MLTVPFDISPFYPLLKDILTALSPCLRVVSFWMITTDAMVGAPNFTQKDDAIAISDFAGEWFLVNDVFGDGKRTFRIESIEPCGYSMQTLDSDVPAIVYPIIQDVPNKRIYVWIVLPHLNTLAQTDHEGGIPFVFYKHKKRLYIEPLITNSTRLFDEFQLAGLQPRTGNDGLVTLSGDWSTMWKVIRKLHEEDFAAGKVKLNNYHSEAYFKK